MSDYESTRQRIISSVFTKLNASGHREEYVAHLKIWEEEGDGARKSRYIILSQSPDGGSIHKSKSNQNGTFSVGKTWRVTELRGVEVINPINFNITLARAYRWQTENPKDQLNFIAALIQLFHTSTQGSLPLNIKGFTFPAAGAASSTPRPQPLDLSNGRRMERAPTPPSGIPLPPASPRRPVATERTNGHARNSSRSEHFDEFPLPASQTPPRARRSATPAQADYSDTSSTRPPPVVGAERPGTPSRTRPGTPSSQTSTIPPALRAGAHARKTSNVASTSSAGSSMLLVPGAAPYRSATPPVANGASKRSAPQAPPISIPVKYNGNYSNGSLSPSPLSTYPSTPDNLPVPLPAQAAPLRKKPSRAPTMDPDTGQPRREQNARVSFYDPANQASLNQLLSGDVVMYESIDDDGESSRVMEDTTAQATLDSMEEMLEGYEWATDDIMGRRSMTGAADRMEARLLDELMALDKANIHSFIESDDRVNIVLKFLDDSISELDNMDSVISSYKIHLNAVNEDIGYIQSQNRGLQVQIQNQRALMDELEELLQTVHVDKEALLALTQESLEKPASIQRLEGAATELYKALQASKDRDMAATFERLDEYRTHNSHFCKRAKILVGDTDGVVKTPQGRPSLMNHRTMEIYLGRYSGLLLYLKDMDEGVYAKLCAAYFAAASGLHSTQETVDDDAEGFGGVTPTTTTAKATSGLRRAGTIARSPLEGRRGKKDRLDGDLTAADALSLVLEEIASAIYREADFIADFLQINDAGLTFADYMGLENYFRRQAARFAGLSQSTLKLVRGALDLIFGFLPTELKVWLDGAMSKDSLQIVGIIVALERFLGDAEERGNTFVLNLLEKQHVRLKGLFERRVGEQIKTIEDMKLTSKKRNGVAPFIKYFPIYIGRVETQLIGADTLEIRQTVDQAYDKIVQSMFDALKQMAKMDGEGEDKGQLNYHVILIENMHYFVAEVAQLQLGSVATFLKRAEAIYEENLNAYVKIVLRRPFFKLIDYFEGIERVLKTTAPSEVPSNSSYSKSALKKVVKEYNAKDVRKHIDSLFKRVEKHFTEASEKATSEDVSTGIASGTVMVGVWKACEDELLRITDLFVKRIDQCYKDMSVGLEYTSADVQAAFKRHRVAA
ncbi:exocyst complex component Sec3-domain-containing protein [Fomitopsis serialis]|uniref:exocyst complex component Sec3-domain-containing protein n=1 Tax=Fomitopsis serialis TaxID=139415 RepID=UPI0020083BE1|nr:exocyst complex component Sec3-domain-containing protein [Neoantrodia serialis]KAH9937263.1 exocyst complex component Sec3-domain-containing protein [Neoantrodia serialis]